MRRKGTSRRHGLSLVEVLVALAIIALIVAALFPTLMPRLRGGQVSAVASQLDYLRIAISNYRQDVRRYPRRLRELTYQLAAGDLDACGAPVSAANRARWNGPYVSRVIDGDFPAGDATIRDTLTRDPPTTSSGPLANLQVVVTNVDSAVARELERQFDGNDDFAAGSILWTPAGGAHGVLRLQTPITGC
jgi:prepilin-type N-terminal cleavage/methylation domain-containing protein